MKGLVFTEFLEMVDGSYSLEMGERILEMSNLPSGGVYTSVGTYDFREMAALVASLSRETGTPADELLKAFGRHLFAKFLVTFPHFFEGITSALDFLSRIDQYVHLEVRKLYPDAELPSFICERNGDDGMIMTYRSSRDLPDLAEGLIRAAFAHYGRPYRIARERIGGDPPGTRFSLVAEA